MKTKVAVGSGWRFYGDDWLHVDGHPYDPVEVTDITLSFVKDNTLDLVYSSHMLEYFDYDEAIELLSGWFKKLKSGGVLRIAVPDFHALTLLYWIKGIGIKDMWGPLCGKMDMDGKKIYHKLQWDWEELEWTLEKIVGFKDVRRYDHKKTEHANVDDHSAAYLAPKGDQVNGTLISLNIECTKP